MNKPNVLLLADTTHLAGAVSDHINAITSTDHLNWHVVNPLLCKTLDYLDFCLFDAVGVHYSIKPYTAYYLSKALKKKIADYSGVTFLFLQDEYQRVNDVQDYLAALRFDLLFTLVNPTLIGKAYPDPRLQSIKTITVLTGYVTKAMKHYESPPITERSVDVSYRARRCDYWLGKLAYEKQFIATEFIQQTRHKGLVLDISLEESARLYGDKWIALLKNSRAVLGTESGASIWDFDRSIEKKTARFLRKNPRADFKTVFEAVLKPYEANILYNAISPRVFEAAALRTPMILFPGDYSGILLPHIHYIPLEKNFSNLDEVLLKLKDTELLQSLADRVFDDLIVSDKYNAQQLARCVAEAILECKTDCKVQHSEQWVTQQLEAHVISRQVLNRIRLVTAEFRFILTQFYQIISDEKYSFAGKLRVLLQGALRYGRYLYARVK